jgi:hypothetical protein
VAASGLVRKFGLAECRTATGTLLGSVAIFDGLFAIRRHDSKVNMFAETWEVQTT